MATQDKSDRKKKTQQSTPEDPSAQRNERDRYMKSKIDGRRMGRDRDEGRETHTKSNADKGNRRRPK